MDIVLYKTMTLSIALTMQEDSMKRGDYWWPTPPESPNLNPIENLWHGGIYSARSEAQNEARAD